MSLPLKYSSLTTIYALFKFLFWIHLLLLFYCLSQTFLPFICLWSHLYSHLSGPTWVLQVICDVPDIQVSFIWLKLRRLICLSFLLWVTLNPSHIPSLSLTPTVAHLAYIRIYRTPKNKKSIIWADTNKTFGYSDMSCSCHHHHHHSRLLGSLLSAAHLGVSV